MKLWLLLSKIHYSGDISYCFHCYAYISERNVLCNIFSKGIHNLTGYELEVPWHNLFQQLDIPRGAWLQYCVTEIRGILFFIYFFATWSERSMHCALWLSFSPMPQSLALLSTVFPCALCILPHVYTFCFTLDKVLNWTSQVNWATGIWLVVHSIWI